MNVACVGWGSLVWDPRDLPIQRRWFGDGPLLPIEFARQSRTGYITLVIVPGARHVRSLWTLMTVPDLDTARVKLAEREGIGAEHAAEHVGHWSSTGPYHGNAAEMIGRWASYLGLDAVVWTNLPPRFHDEARVPRVDEVIPYLQHLPPESREGAERYVRRTPRQIDTDYRRRIEVELNWTPLDDDDVVTA